MSLQDKLVAAALLKRSKVGPDTEENAKRTLENLGGAETRVLEQRHDGQVKRQEKRDRVKQRKASKRK